MTGTDIVPSSDKPEHTAIIPAPGGDVVAQDNKNDADFILVGDVITDAEVINETKKRKPVEFLAAPQERPKQDAEPQSKTKELLGNRKAQITAGVGGVVAISMLVNSLFTDPPPSADTAPAQTTSAQSTTAAQDFIRKYGGGILITVPTPPAYSSATNQQKAEELFVLPNGPVFKYDDQAAAKDTNNIRIVADRTKKPVLLAPIDTINRLSDKAMSNLFNHAIEAQVGGYIQPSENLGGRRNPATLILPLGPWQRTLAQMQIIDIIRTGHKENVEKHPSGEHKHLVIHANANLNFTNGVAWELCDKYENMGGDKYCLTPKTAENFALDIE